MNGSRWKMGAPPSNRSKDRDEDLSLFREMQRRDKDRVVSLLQPVSEEFEANGNYPIYGMASAKKGPGFGFLGESEKNDYDWLKTPPATPLFPSLEMDSKNSHEMIAQKELPILQPLSRFAGKSEENETKPKSSEATAGRSKTPNLKPRIPARSVTPSGRSSSLFTDQKKNVKNPPTQLSSSINRTNGTDVSKKPSQTPSVSKPVSERDSHLNFLAANLSKSIRETSSSSKTRQKSRGVSPLVRSTISTQIPGFSDETPPNLRTDRSISASRGRPANQTQSTLSTAPQKPENSSARARRQSCSPSNTRGRKGAPTTSEENTNIATSNLAAQKGSNRLQTGNGGQILGSRMVDKLMNARKSSIEEKDTKLKLNGSINEGSGFGRLMSKSSLDMAVKHMEVKRDSVHSRQVGVAAGRKPMSTNYTNLR